MCISLSVTPVSASLVHSSLLGCGRTELALRPHVPPPKNVRTEGHRLFVPFPANPPLTLLADPEPPAALPTHRWLVRLGPDLGRLTDGVENVVDQIVECDPILELQAERLRLLALGEQRVDDALAGMLAAVGLARCEPDLVEPHLPSRRHWVDLALGRTLAPDALPRLLRLHDGAHAEAPVALQLRLQPSEEPLHRSLVVCPYRVRHRALLSCAAHDL